jgi:hypothetical protein
VPGRLLLVCAVLAALAASAPAAAATDRHLRVLEQNGRYFGDGSGKAVYLTGSHVWWNLSAPDWTASCDDAEASFTWDGYLDRLVRLGHNFVRLWRIEHTRWDECGGEIRNPFQPWRRSGIALALDGEPKFDLTRFDPSYFERLRHHVASARRRGIYVSVMLFDGWSLHAGALPWAWTGHPFNAENNVNGFDGDLDGDGRGTEIDTLADPAVVALEKRYVKKVVQTVNRYDNVLYEIANEAGGWSLPWQVELVRYVKAVQRANGGRRPVGITYPHPGSSNDALSKTPADWISPWSPAYMSDPPAAGGSKVIVSDTDHHCGVCGDAGWPWRSFLRGLNPIYMDPLDLAVLDPGHAAVRRALGQTRRLALRFDLAGSRPRPRLSSTRYALAAGRRQLIAYQPGSGPFAVDLRGSARRYAVEWFSPASGTTRRRAGTVPGGKVRTFVPPSAGPAVLFLKAVR